MQEPVQVERLWWPRLRWRMRGAWQWPAFAVLTALDALVILELPYYEAGPGSLVGAFLLAVLLNLVAVAVIAPLAGRGLRRRRRDLPAPIARDYAGTAALAAIAALLLAGGLLHRPAVAAEREAERAAVVAMHDFVLEREPGLAGNLSALDAMRVEEDLYRTCVPRARADRWLCLYVSTDRTPAGVREDREQVPNSSWQVHGGFR